MTLYVCVVMILEIYIILSTMCFGIPSIRRVYVCSCIRFYADEMSLHEFLSVSTYSCACLF